MTSTIKTKAGVTGAAVLALFVAAGALYGVSHAATIPPVGVINQGASAQVAAVSNVPSQISESEAVRLAKLAYVGDGKVTETGLETVKNALVYAVEFTESDGNEADVKLDAHTGAIVVIESDKTEKPGTEMQDDTGVDGETKD